MDGHTYDFSSDVSHYNSIAIGAGSGSVQSLTVQQHVVILAVCTVAIAGCYGLALVCERIGLDF